MVRHFTNTSRRNFSIDQGFYPLGSCTMKYNPKINDRVADLPGLALVHPCQDEATTPGMLRLLGELQEWLGEIAGLPAVSLQPSAGAHGELTGALIIRAYQEAAGRRRTTMLVPDSAHGTNPATVTMVGYRARTVPTGPRGNLDFGALQEALDDEVAGLMITNPNTLGLFEERILETAAAVHAVGGLIYMDGANMNAMLGAARPGDLGMDILHFNLHKTFSVPHGGGGPGAGAIAVTPELAPFLPAPVLSRRDDGFHFDHDRPQSIGRVRAFHGNVNNAVRGYAYLRSLGGDGLAEVSRLAVGQRQLRARTPEGGAGSAVPARLQARSGVQRPAASRAAPGAHSRPRQAADRLRHPPADHLLPPYRAGSADGRAHRDRVQGHPRPLRRRAARHPGRGRRYPRPGTRGSPLHPARPPRRGHRRPPPDPGLAAVSTRPDRAGAEHGAFPAGPRSVRPGPFHQDVFQSSGGCRPYRVLDGFW